MIRWVREHSWLPEILLSLSLFAILGGVDFASSGALALVPALLSCVSILFIRRFLYLAPVALLMAATMQISFGLDLLLSSFAGLLTVLLQAAFGTLIWRQVTVIVSNVAGFSIVWLVVFQNDLRSVGGLVISNESARWILFSGGAVLDVALNTLAWIFGRLLITRLTHVGTTSDRAKLLHDQARLSIEVARQTERLGIARDLTDLLVQRISAVVSLVQGANYTAKIDTASALRALDKIESSAMASQQELRRLYDMLHQDHKMTSAPPRIADIEPIVIAMRELGYNAAMTTDGVPFDLDEGAELCIFKIVFEALENVKKNTVLGTSVTVDFYWTNEGLQVLIKDNGVETKVRNGDSTTALMGYSVADDLDALVRVVDGATLRVLRERVALYEGSIEANHVAGVGFTLSALFPHLKAVAGI